ncbi:septal ring lytic transglycosylase RlpA family protein [Luteimonas sp. 8-5]|uniref:septal ring lytic transglycosylase RlpA family protein n=1 Tax=Luteimonas sp. 8-5 TaxID=3039387 RepID=UPI002436D3EB|nr:septal ring lytic transglycosylase RlpA family protein [Luteimonas sp. 8-5]MDG6347657.1 septal ring lytic transglycosylase RlpA family protein [Luteimonas sp. 8-5]
MKRLAAAATCLLLAACAGNPPKPPPLVAVPDPAPGNGAPRRSPYAPAQEDVSKRGNYTAGGLYAPGVADSAPAGGIPDVHLIPEPEVVAEPHSRYGNRSPYTVLGKKYYVRDSAEGYHETGIASYYGNKFHGRRTSNLEVYDMYAFTAAHKTLPLPSFARVTNLANGSSVVVRVNDRGPFHDGRIIDLSYAAAVKLGVDRAGTARVEVVGLMPGENARQQYDAVAAAPPQAPLPPTAIDQLVAALPVATAAAAPAVPGVVLQVASFAEEANAQRALATVNAAGIAGASLEPGDSAGRPVWRLRIGPVPAEAMEATAERVRALGFGQPRLVRE